MSETKQKLQTVLDELRTFSNKEISATEFNNFVQQVKKTTSNLRTELNDQDQVNQLDSIIHFRTLDQLTSIERTVIRFLAPDKYRWAELGWNKKGKYIYDLDQLELKLGGLIYKLEQGNQNVEN